MQIGITTGLLVLVIFLFLLSLIVKDYFENIEGDLVRRVVLFTLGISGTILVSYLSHRYVESWFLKKKEKFMLIKSSTTGTNHQKEKVFSEQIIEQPNLIFAKLNPGEKNY